MKKLVVGILAHVDAGKTTLSESMLYTCGAIRKMGRVDHKDTFLDTFELERNRGITIFSKQAVFSLGDIQVTLLDTPGHVDFSAEMERTLQVLDYAILVISGADGIQGHTQTLWKLLKRYQIPTFLFVNKMDQPDTDKNMLMEELKKRLDDNCLDFSADCKSEVWMEQLAMCDENLLEHYLDEGIVDMNQIPQLICERKVFPCFFGSALKMTGVEEFLHGIEIGNGDSFMLDFGKSFQMFILIIIEPLHPFIWNCRCTEYKFCFRRGFPNAFYDSVNILSKHRSPVMVIHTKCDNGQIRLVRCYLHFRIS